RGCAGARGTSRSSRTARARKRRGARVRSVVAPRLGNSREPLMTVLKKAALVAIFLGAIFLDARVLMDDDGAPAVTTVLVLAAIVLARRPVPRQQNEELPAAETKLMAATIAAPQLADPAGVMVACLDATGHCTWISRALAQRVGAAPVDLIGQ